MKEGFIEVSGGKVWYQIHNEEAKGIPLLVLHGGPGSSSFSMQGLSELAIDRRVIIFDQLGCGRSDRPNDDSLWILERFVQEVAQVRESLGLEDVHILGHSWGTTLAAAYYLSGALGIKSIIFSSPCLSAPLWQEDQKKNLKKLPREIQDIIAISEENETTDTPEYLKAIEVFNNHFVCRLNPYPEHLKKGKSYRNPHVYQLMWGPSEFTVKGNLKSFDCTGDLSQIQIPTLYTCGKFDEATPESTEYFSSLTPNGKFHVFENSAHMAYIEEPEEYLTVMNEFLKSIH
ncbi:proline iminopeptidase-family hydrolase [Bacillus sp. B1-b2]|uniref:proline iminopeptidase-family hydrolase n=1 Tax=Bacillus sp. B1-b2 TaxID=2653201 RepID=UPI0012623D84|nr:proline iminopeptidase-family hydrolase [Bacillus sp. B1-b2]KAB7673092.1 alpha/beta fold hydrolase [Bacillus sp. B1-b2]